jgi:hypothetical protein
MTDFHDREVFPSWADLPEEGVLFVLGHHHCFLGEITEIGSYPMRLELMLKDVDGDTVKVSFYTDERGLEIPASRLRKGYTVAILDAVNHYFLDGTSGIRHEDPGAMKVQHTPFSVNFLAFLLTNIDIIRSYLAHCRS